MRGTAPFGKLTHQLTGPQRAHAKQGRQRGASDGLGWPRQAWRRPVASRQQAQSTPIQARFTGHEGARGGVEAITALGIERRAFRGGETRCGIEGIKQGEFQPPQGLGAPFGARQRLEQGGIEGEHVGDGEFHRQGARQQLIGIEPAQQPFADQQGRRAAALHQAQALEFTLAHPGHMQRCEGLQLGARA